MPTAPSSLIRGERFCDELDHPEYKLVEQPEQYAYIVFDGRLEATFAVSVFRFNRAGCGLRLCARLRTQPQGMCSAKRRPSPRWRRNFGADPDIFAKSIRERNASLPAQTGKGGIAADALTIENGLFTPWGRSAVSPWAPTPGSQSTNAFRSCANKTTDTRAIGAGTVAFGGLMAEGHGHHLGWAFTPGPSGRAQCGTSRQHRQDGAKWWPATRGRPGSVTADF
jgi:fumarate reductase flavoprotein subunit